MTSEAGVAADSEVPAKEFSVRNVQLRQVVFDAPRVPRMRGLKVAAEDIALTVTRRIDGQRKDLYDLALTIDVHAVVNGETIFRAMVEEVGVFRIVGYPDDEVRAMLGTRGAEQIYPYAREFILSMVSRCGFQNLSLRPFNFTLPAEAQ